MSRHPAPFDGAAADYDRRFTQTRLGRALRDRVHRHLSAWFQAPDRVLELGCGTGEDAVRLAGRGIRVDATDLSHEMLAVAARKIEAAGVADRVRLFVLDAARLAEHLGTPTGTPRPEPPYDGVIADFGVLNCVADRPALAASLAGVLKPGGILAAVVMGPCCPAEVVGQLLLKRPRAAARRWRNGRAARIDDAHSVRVWYPTPRRLARDLSPHFRRRSAAPIGVALPPSDLAPRVERRRRLLTVLEAADRIVSRLPAAAWLADHYLMVLERRESLDTEFLDSL